MSNQWSQANDHLKRQRTKEEGIQRRDEEAATRAAQEHAAQVALIDPQIRKRVQQFLKAMKAAGNPGIKYGNFWNRLTGYGRWSIIKDLSGIALKNHLERQPPLDPFDKLIIAPYDYVDTYGGWKLLLAAHEINDFRWEHDYSEPGSGTGLKEMTFALAALLDYYGIPIRKTRTKPWKFRRV